MPVAHPVVTLWDALAGIEYPAGTARVPERIPGTSFFPGGPGLWMPTAGQDLPPMPVGGVMVVGQDFYSETGYHEILERAKRHNDPHPSRATTWRNLLKLLNEVPVREPECFFTNVYMGLRAGSGPNTGPFPGAKCRAFVEQCRTFFRQQLAAQRPRVILVLGAPATNFLAGMSPDLAPWSQKKMAAIDAAEAAVIAGARFETGDGVHVASAVTLCHPSYRERHVPRRKYGRFHGHAAEVEMVRDATRGRAA